MSNRNQDERAKGTAEEINGTVKSGIGALVDDRQLEAEGQADQAEGQARQDVAKVTERAKGADTHAAPATRAARRAPHHQRPHEVRVRHPGA
jgi:uncharacterized protein YjbJ (UPF0337 family)